MSEDLHDNGATASREDPGPWATNADAGQSSLVAPATAIAFLAFLVIDALAGEPAAGIVFLGVIAGAVLVLPAIVLAIGRARRARKRDILDAASLAADLALKRARGESRSDA